MYVSSVVVPELAPVGCGSWGKGHPTHRSLTSGLYAQSWVPVPCLPEQLVSFPLVWDIEQAGNHQLIPESVFQPQCRGNGPPTLLKTI